MKKLLAILLTLSMLASFVVLPTFADEAADAVVEETPEEEIEEATQESVEFHPYHNAISWFDAEGKNKLEALDSEKNYLLLRPGHEWAKYSIEGLKEGTYSVTLTYVNIAEDVKNLIGLDFVVDDALELKSNLGRTTSVKGNSWFDDSPATVDVGNIYIPAGAKELKVKNHGYKTLAITGFKLTYIEAGDSSEDIVLYGSNAMSGIVDGNHTIGVYREGIDFHDVAGAGFLNTASSTSGVIHHAGDWTKYDISDFKTGTYLVTFNTSQPNNIRVGLKINDKPALEGTATANGAYDTNYSDYELGKIYISDEAETLTLENISNNSYYGKYLKFEYLSEERDADTIPSYKINGAEIYSNVPEEGFHANTINNPTNSAEISSGTSIILRGPGEWAAYDVSDLENGTYTLSIEYKTSAINLMHFNFYLDDVLLSNTEVINQDNTETYTQYTINVSSIRIDSDSKILKVVNSGTSAAYLDSLNFTYQTSPTEEAYKIRKYANNVTLHDEMPEGAERGSVVCENGVDYYDAGGAAYINVFEGNRATLHSGDWARYDISGIKAGKYKVTANYSTASTTARLLFKADGNVVLGGNLANAGTAPIGTTYFTLDIGNIYFDENADYLVVENIGPASVYLKYIDFELIDGDETGMPEVKINGYDIYSRTHNEGFYDNSGNGIFEAHSAGAGAALRAGEWAAYDVSELKAGTYDVSLNIAAQQVCNVKAYLGDMQQANFFTERTATDSYYRENKDYPIGSIYVNKDSEYIKIYNPTQNVIMLEHLTFSYKSEKDTSSVHIEMHGYEPLLVNGEIVEGTSYYDGDNYKTGENDTSEGFEHSTAGAVIREGDWVRYDISGFDLAPGVYTVYGNLSNQNNAITSEIGLSVDNETKVRKTSVAGGTTSADKSLLGMIIVGEDTTSFKVSLSSSNRIILKTLIIERDAEESTSVIYSSDEAGVAIIDSLAGLESAYVTTSLLRPNQATIAETVYIALYDGARLKSVIPVPATTAFEFVNTTEVTGLAECTAPVIKTFVWENSSYAPIISTTGTTITAQ